MQHLEVTINWYPGHEVPAEILSSCARLYSQHYGIWGSSDPAGRGGRPVRLKPERLREFLDSDSWVALAFYDDQLIGYAFAVWGTTTSGKSISWVTQLVVHDAYRNQDVAKQILNALWGFTDHYAWGLVTSNPFAVRALEKVTRRRCEPEIIQTHGPRIVEFGQERIPYISESPLYLDATRSIIDTKFFVSHEGLPNMLQQATGHAPWTLGPIEEGQEWLAFTVNEQPARNYTPEELEHILADSARIARHAYERMTLDHGHKWAKSARAEVDYLIEALQLTPAMTLLDMGCGKGRHVLELGRRGYSGKGIDFAKRLIEDAIETAKSEGLQGVEFFEADCRAFTVDQPVDAIICLYDVIGSFPDDAQNDAIIQRIAANLRIGGRVLVSVMNLELTEHQAQHTANVKEHPEALMSLPPSSTMQDTGEIFNPNYYLLDPSTSLVYRKEQFKGDHQLPAELIVRDRRYRRVELIEKFAAVGITMRSCDYVRSGGWKTPLTATDPHAKEILFCGEKIAAD